MRCLIPVHQENYPKNALNRAIKLCDEVVLLYIVDKKLIEKVQGEASYILPSYSLEKVEDFILEMHRQEAEKIKNSIRGVPVELRFAVGEYYGGIEREVLRNSPNMIMCDSYIRGLLKINVPIWIDRGDEIRECTMIIASLKRIKRIKHGVELAKNVCERLNSAFYIYYPPGDKGGIDALKPLGRMVNTLRGQLLVYLKDQILKTPKNVSLLLI